MMDPVETSRFGGRPRETGLLARRPARLLAVLLAAEALGYGLAWGAGRFGDLGPLILFGLVVLPAALVVFAIDRVLGVASVFLALPIWLMTGGVDILRPLIMVLAGVVVLARLGSRWPRLPAPVWWLVGLTGWTLVSVPFAIQRQLAVSEATLLFVTLVWVIVVIVVCPRGQDVHKVIAAFLGIVVAGIVVGLSGSGLGTIAPIHGGSLVAGRALGFTGEANSWGTLCMMAALVAFAMALGGARGRWRIVSSVVTLITMGGLLLSFSRGAWIGTAIGILVLAGTLPQARRVLLVVGLGLIPLAALDGAVSDSPQIGVVGARLQSIVGEQNPYDQRRAIWAEARQQIMDHPVVGKGPGSFPEASRRAGAEEGTTFFALHAHNLLLNWGAETGIPAMVILIGLGVHVAVLSRRARRRASARGRPQDVALLAGLTAALAGVAAQGLVDYTLRHTSGVQIAVAGILGLLLAAISAQAGVETVSKTVSEIGPSAINVLPRG